MPALIRKSHYDATDYRCPHLTLEEAIECLELYDIEDLGTINNQVGGWLYRDASGVLYTMHDYGEGNGHYYVIAASYPPAPPKPAPRPSYPNLDEMYAVLTRFYHGELAHRDAAIEGDRPIATLTIGTKRYQVFESYHTGDDLLAEVYDI